MLHVFVLHCGELEWGHVPLFLPSLLQASKSVTLYTSHMFIAHCDELQWGHLLRVIKASMDDRQNERLGEMRDPRENLDSSHIQDIDKKCPPNIHLQKSKLEHVMQAGRGAVEGEAWRREGKRERYKRVGLVTGTYLGQQIFTKVLPHAFLSFTSKRGSRWCSCFHQGKLGLIPDTVAPRFCMWKSCRTMLLVSGFSWRAPNSSTLAFQCCSIRCFTLIGSQELDIKSRPNLFTHSLNVVVSLLPAPHPADTPTECQLQVVSCLGSDNRDVGGVLSVMILMLLPPKLKFPSSVVKEKVAAVAGVGCTVEGTRNSAHWVSAPRHATGKCTSVRISKVKLDALNQSLERSSPFLVLENKTVLGKALLPSLRKFTDTRLGSFRTNLSIRSELGYPGIVVRLKDETLQSIESESTQDRHVVGNMPAVVICCHRGQRTKLTAVWTKGEIVLSDGPQMVYQLPNHLKECALLSWRRPASAYTCIRRAKTVLPEHAHAAALQRHAGGTPADLRVGTAVALSSVAKYWVLTNLFPGPIPQVSVYGLHPPRPCDASKPQESGSQPQPCLVGPPPAINMAAALVPQHPHAQVCWSRAAFLWFHALLFSHPFVFPLFHRVSHSSSAVWKKCVLASQLRPRLADCPLLPVVSPVLLERIRVVQQGYGCLQIPVSVPGGNGITMGPQQHLEVTVPGQAPDPADKDKLDKGTCTVDRCPDNQVHFLLCPLHLTRAHNLAVLWLTEAREYRVLNRGGADLPGCCVQFVRKDEKPLTCQTLYQSSTIRGVPSRGYIAHVHKVPLCTGPTVWVTAERVVFLLCVCCPVKRAYSPTRLETGWQDAVTGLRSREPKHDRGTPSCLVSKAGKNNVMTTDVLRARLALNTVDSVFLWLGHLHLGDSSLRRQCRPCCSLLERKRSGVVFPCVLRGRPASLAWLGYSVEVGWLGPAVTCVVLVDEVPYGEVRYLALQVADTLLPQDELAIPDLGVTSSD
ncbi:hypothetical protein PR048_009102 [Dryococelus australis]|uniref:CST complex subunit CTC1 n=1 Tax=Dryococelus australis TaxID=614101 RepID=A0ABQ9HYY6_9NEOP|nr:hypothetical protein PR048_009102 [Dryococelus australis]